MRLPPARLASATPPQAAGRSILLGAAVATVVAAFVVIQVANLDRLIDPDEVLTAGRARALLLGYGLAVAAIGAWAALAPQRLVPVAAYAAASVGGLALLGTLTLGAQIWPFLVAVLTLAATWQLGSWLLRALGRPDLARIVPVAWLAGVTPLGFAILALGRAGWLEWWTAGLPVMALGAVGMWRLALALRGGRGAAGRLRPVLHDRVAAAAAGVIALTLGVASIWTAAPEVMFDALFGKAWLPSEWARTGEIAPLILHPAMNNIGFPQLMAVPGHLLDAPEVGRYMQWMTVLALAITVWWIGRASRWGAVAAVVIVATPHFVWQAATANDDVLLAFGAAGMALAVLTAASASPAGPWRTGAVIGLLAGTMINLKIHLGVLALALAAAWWIVQVRGNLRAAVGIAGGGLLAAAPPLVLRWIDTGNPVLPAYNNVFGSTYWPPVNEKLNFPFVSNPGDLGPLSLIGRALTDPGSMTEAAPVGAFGLLVGIVVVALLLGWLRRGTGRPALVLWLAIVLPLVAWYAQFRYLRYLLPLATVALLVLLLLAGRRSTSRAAEVGGIAVLAVVAVLAWPTAVAQFWNVPGKDLPVEAAFGFRDTDEYEKTSMPERDGLAAYDRLAPPGALAVSGAHQRIWLTKGRDLAPNWEIRARMLARWGEEPATPGQMYRRLRELGVGWAVDTAPNPISADERYQDLLADHGQLLYRDSMTSVFRLAEEPRQPRPWQTCDPRLIGRPGCWEGTLDDEPGYRGEESPGGIARTVPTCPGQVVLATVTVGAGPAPVTAAVRFEPRAELASEPAVVVPPSTAGTVGGPAPARTSRAVLAIVAPAGTVVERVVARAYGTCAD